MSINTIISHSLSGLFTSQAGLRTTSNNVANVNTPGYARQEMQQEVIVSGTKAGGVKVSGINRVIDEFLVDAKRAATSEADRYAVEREFHNRLEILLGNPTENDSLGGKLDNVYRELAEAAITPSSTTLRTTTISAYDEYGKELDYLTREIQNLRGEASNQLDELIDKANTLLERIERLNPLIIQQQVMGNDAGALEEQRAQALGQLSEIIDISTSKTSNGGIQVTTSSGVMLLGTTRMELQYNAPGTVTAETNFPPITLHEVDPISGETGLSRGELGGNILSGRLKGLLDMRDVILPDMAAEIGTLASAYVDQVNAIHNANAAYPGPNSLVGDNSGLLANDLHHFTGEAVFAITDSQGNVVSRVDVDFDSFPGGTINDVLTTVNAGLGGNGTLSFVDGVMSFTANNATHGVVIAQTDGDPSSRSGRGFSHFFGMNDLLTSRVPAHFETGVQLGDNHGFTPGGTANFVLGRPGGNTVAEYTLTIAGTSNNDILNDLNSSPLGTYAVFSLSANGEFIMTPKAGAGDISLNVTADTTSRGATGISISRFFGIGHRYDSDPARDVRVESRIREDAAYLALGKFDQTAVVGQSALSVGDQAGAVALQQLETRQIAFEASGGLTSMNATMGQYASSVLADFGLRSSAAHDLESDSSALLDELTTRNADISGVNLDEELSDMVIYQQAYNASARLLTVAQELYDALLRVV
ncbi:MAG: flagellar hook-associated protein FlgK [Kordiimonas sp.]|nr:flagellar hook-associated protein FlgK [Kordiimonas sp.]